MEQEQRQAAKRQMLELMQAGQPWRAAAAAAGIWVSRSTAYRWQKEVRTRGEACKSRGSVSLACWRPVTKNLPNGNATVENKGTCKVKLRQIRDIEGSEQHGDD